MRLIPHHSRTVFMPGNLAQVLAFHLVTLLLAPWFFTWQAFAFAWVAMVLFAYPMGIFHHMYLTHRAFTAKRWVERFFLTLGTLTWRGPFAGPIQYVAMHRIHHAYSDTDLDPHTPNKGLFFALMAWFWRMPYGLARPDQYEAYTPDLVEDPYLRWLDRHVHLLQIMWAGVAFVIGVTMPLWQGGSLDWLNGLRFVIYGVFVKTFMLCYLVNLVDVINHRLGYRNFATSDQSSNSLLMGVLHGGGAVSWHNNHHAHPAYMLVKQHWWEYDLHYSLLKLMARFGLVAHIKVLDLSQEQQEVLA